MIITVEKIVDNEGNVIPNTTAKVWRNIQESETETTMTIEVLEE